MGPTKRIHNSNYQLSAMSGHQYHSETKLNEDVSKRLIVACSNARRLEVEKLIDEDPNIEVTINLKNALSEETAAHAAATGGDHYIIQMLLENGADITLSDREGNTPLMRAAAVGNLEAVQVFISNDENSIYQQGSKGVSPFHCVCLISNPELVDHFLELDEDKKLLKLKDIDGNSAWHSAANAPIKVEVLRALLEHGANIDETNNNGETALLLCARAGAVNAAKFLIEKGAKPNIAAKNGMTPLHEFAFRKYLEGVTLLINHPEVDIEAETQDGETALALACAGGDMAIVKILIEKGSDVNKGCLHCAAQFGRESVVKMLLAKGVKPDSLNKKGLTPLFSAVEGDQPDMIKLLCENKANPTKKCKSPDSGKSMTPQNFAKEKFHDECAKNLKKAEKECIIM